MGAVVLDSGVKPEQWGFDPGHVAPEWEWFWDDPGLVAAYPLWSPGVMRDFGSRGYNNVNANTGSLTAGIAGPGFTYTGTQRHELGTAINSDIQNAVTFVFALTSPDTSSGTLLDSQVGTASGFQVSINTPTAGKFNFYVDTGASINVRPAAKTGFVVAVCRWDGTTGNATVEQNDGSKGTGNLTGAALGASTCKIGNAQNNGVPLGANRVLHGLYIFDREISDAQSQHFLYDFFGPFRMNDEVPYFVPAAAGGGAGTGAWLPLMGVG